MKKFLIPIKIIFVAGLLYWAILSYDMQAARTVIASADPLLAVLSVIGVFVSALFAAWRWRIILRGFISERAPVIIKLLFFNLLAGFYTVFLPTSVAGEAVRLVKLSKDTKTDYVRSMLSVTFDRILGVTTWLALFLILPLPFKGKQLWPLAILIVPAALFIWRDKLSYKGYRLANYYGGNGGQMSVAAFASLCCQVSYLVGIILLFRCLGMRLDIWQAAGLITASVLTGIVPISVLGVGLREGFLVASLKYYGVSPTAAILAMTATVLMNYFFSLIGGVVELGHAGWSITRMKKEDATNGDQAEA